jgi:hypothetical protein
VAAQERALQASNHPLCLRPGPYTRAGERRTVSSAPRWLEPWVATGDTAPALARELAAEVGPGHPLFGASVAALARRLDRDDVLFAVAGDARHAVVHLTWGGRLESDPAWPAVTFYASLADWVERSMKPEYVAEVVEACIARYLADPDSRLGWVRAAVREHRFLPLYLGWVASLGIRPDGSFVRWDHEDAPAIVAPLVDAWSRRFAIHQGAKTYPELAPLVPERPVEASDCKACGGAGKIVGAPEVICACGGIGWIIPGEPRGPTAG